MPDTPSILVGRQTIQVMSRSDGEHRMRTFATLLEKHIRPRKRTLADLGAGHCKFGMLAARLGYDVTAVDGRTERVPADLGAVRFIHSDIRQFDPSGFGVVAILGLLYHLEISDQERLLDRCADGAAVIVETQVHVPEMVPVDSPRPWHAVVEREGYDGVEFPENDNPMAAIGNTKSFWHTEDSLIRLFARSGFRHVQLIDPLFSSAYGARRFYLLAT
ncbi:class I SAM-dependent methyltransferase [Rhodopila sp.]|jgi:hypothetical protein|uniref:class I SAM-dependent methyltransferase n=1 Tax=Rhodopila sp. TaxID=2480087 RepID=UPI002B830032|nr:hypothetical protein [Rhodopila sp.]HVZ10024.1 hypothetical protein [Rhodopila sp.]